MSRIVLATIFLLSAGCAATAPPKHYLCHFTSGEITVDGRLDEPAWQAAPWTDPFVDIEGDRRPRPRFETRAKMLFDGQNLYVAAFMEEPHVWATLTDRDAVVYHDNDFEVFIDPDGDTRDYYEVEINAHNTIFDLLLVRTYIDGGPALHDWNLRGMVTAVAVRGTLNDPTDTDEAWTVELALPWPALAEHAHKPAPPPHGDVWRVNFSRVQWRHRVVGGDYEKVPDVPEDNWVWSPQGVINMHLPQHWGRVEFTLQEP